MSVTLRFVLLLRCMGRGRASAGYSYAVLPARGRAERARDRRRRAARVRGLLGALPRPAAAQGELR